LSRRQPSPHRRQPTILPLPLLSGSHQGCPINYSARTPTSSRQSDGRHAQDGAGFYQAVHKFFVVVELLMGDIQIEALSAILCSKKALSATSILSKVNMITLWSLYTTTDNIFWQPSAQDHSPIQTTSTNTRPIRVRQDVHAYRPPTSKCDQNRHPRLSLSYSRISLRDICVKLHIDSERMQNIFVGKAIRDGVIEGASYMRKAGWSVGSQKGGYGLRSATCFARRIGYCLELHNEV